jgi:transposase-like protein
MQILHPLTGSIQQYQERILDPDHDRPEQCPQCQARQSLRGHGFYGRTLEDVHFRGTIRVRRFLCRSCRRTLSLLSQLALCSLRFSASVICRFLLARLLRGADRNRTDA